MQAVGRSGSLKVIASSKPPLTLRRLAAMTVPVTTGTILALDLGEYKRVALEKCRLGKVSRSLD